MLGNLFLGRRRARRVKSRWRDRRVTITSNNPLGRVRSHSGLGMNVGQESKEGWRDGGSASVGGRASMRTRKEVFRVQRPARC